MSVKSMSMQRVFVALVACVLLAAAALAAVAAAPSQAFATKGDPYTYTVRIFPGNVGECSAGDCLINDEVAAGKSVSIGVSGDGTALYFNGNTITVPYDSKYYIKGVRPSGEDELVKRMAFDVNEDMDFVVAYGVKGEMVSYTINFVEYGTGNAVATDQGATSVTYRGKLGDKPVVPYEYVPGYRPRYMNITGTLGPEGSNNWTLEYIPLTTEEVVETTTEGGAAAGGAAAGGAAAGGAAAGGEAAGGAAAGGAAAGGAAGGAAATPPATEEIVDVDNPLASGTDKDQGNKLGASATGTASESGGLPIVPIVGGIVAALAVIAALAATLGRKKN